MTRGRPPRARLRVVARPSGIQMLLITASHLTDRRRFRFTDLTPLRRRSAPPSRPPSFFFERGGETSPPPPPPPRPRLPPPPVGPGLASLARGASQGGRLRRRPVASGKRPHHTR